jgi:Protein of unknown function (DUF1579)
MNRIILTICTLSVILFSCNNADETKQDKALKADSTVIAMDTASMPVMDSAAMMKAWQDYMTPGNVHAMIAKSNGTWTEDVTLWMAPGAPPQKSTSTVVNKMILGGRYQESHHTGSMMGMPFEGISTLGYDNAKKTFQSSWVDNMGTGVMYMEGPWDSTTHTINLKGKVTEPGSGKSVDVRETFTLTDENNQKMEMFAMDKGKEYKSMEINLKRK